jgi:hypothetical protein
VTYAFTSLHTVWPNSGEHQYANGMGIYATDQTGATGNAETWTVFSAASMGYVNGFSSGGSSTEYNAALRWVPLHGGMIFFRGLVQTPSSGNVNNVVITTVPTGYAPANYSRIPLMCTSTPSSTGGYLILHQNGNLLFQGAPSLNSATFDITGMMSPVT